MDTVKREFAPGDLFVDVTEESACLRCDGCGPFPQIHFLGGERGADQLRRPS